MAAVSVAGPACSTLGMRACACWSSAGSSRSGRLSPSLASSPAEPRKLQRGQEGMATVCHALRPVSLCVSRLCLLCVSGVAASPSCMHHLRNQCIQTTSPPSECATRRGGRNRIAKLCAMPTAPSQAMKHAHLHNAPKGESQSPLHLPRVHIHLPSGACKLPFGAVSSRMRLLSLLMDRSRLGFTDCARTRASAGGTEAHDASPLLCRCCEVRGGSFETRDGELERAQSATYVV